MSRSTGYDPTPGRSSSRSSLGESAALDASDYGNRFDAVRGSSGERSSSGETRTEPAFPGAIDLDDARSVRTRFPAPYRASSSSTRPAVPSRSGSPELIGLVDRYREAARASYATSDRSSVAPVLDRYGRSGRTDSATGPSRSALELNAQRYARGPQRYGREGHDAHDGSEREDRHGPGAGSSVAASGATGRSSAAPSRSRGVARGVERGVAGDVPSGRSRAAAARSTERSARLDSAAPSAPERARKLATLAARDPEAGRRVLSAGNALARGTALGLATGMSITSGRVAGGLVLGAHRVPTIDRGYGSSYWGYGYYPWWGGGFGSSSSWWFGFGWSPGWCGWPSWYWSPFWACSWYPFYYYSYYHYYPYYCKPYYYYPFYYSTVVHHVYDDYDPVVVVVRDDADDVVYVDEPVGEAAVAAGAALDSPLKLDLSIAAERYLTLGDRAFREGRYSDAAQFYAKAVEFAPNEGVMHLVLADALFATGDYHYAAYSIRRALELNPALAEAVVDKHEFYADPADFDRHIAQAELFVEGNPTDIDAKLVLAANYLFGNRPAAAVDLLEREVALSLRADTAAALLLRVARDVQHGAPAHPGR